MSETPRWLRALARVLAPQGQADDVLGDLVEVHRDRLRHRHRFAAVLLTTVEAIEMAGTVVRARVARWWLSGGNSVLQDYRLGLRMLVKYPGLTIAGGLALAIAIGLGAGWYDLTRSLLRPVLPLPGGERIVEIEMRTAAGSGEERRIAYDFLAWRRDARTVETLGAWRTLERNLVLGDSRPEPVTVAEITPSAFALAGVEPALGRPLVEADARPGAPPAAVLGYDLWRRRFDRRPDIVGRAVQLGRDQVTVVGVMPENFAFPVNHRMWMPLQLPAAGVAPLEGPGLRVFARLAPGMTQAAANVELTTLTAREAAASPATHEHLRPRVLAFGGESPGDRSLLELAVTHVPVLLVLLIACANVGTLIYARTATREAEIAVRSALGAGRARIVLQLFVEALVLAGISAAAGLAAAHQALQWGLETFYGAQPGGPPFWIQPGLHRTTVIYAAGLTVVGAAILGVLPGLRVTSRPSVVRLRESGVGGATLRFGRVWTTAMVAQVALTVICVPAAMGVAWESLRDSAIRARFPAASYLAVRLGVDRETGALGGDDDEASVAHRAQLFAALQQRLRQEPGVGDVSFGSRLPGMPAMVRRAEVETQAGAVPLDVENLWTSSVGPGYFETFGSALVSGRDFDAGDRAPGRRTALVNQAFARRFAAGGSPVGARVRFAAATPDAPEAWFEIVGMVKDVGMTPTDLGEAPYLFLPADPARLVPAVMAVRVEGDAARLAPVVRAVAAALDPGLRLDEVDTLDHLAWRVDLPQVVVATALVGVVGLGLFLSAAGIFALMSVSVSRRRREIGLRSALGASRRRLLTAIFSRAAALVGAGIAVGNLILVAIIEGAVGVRVVDVWGALVTTSAVMLAVGLLACVEPARRALRIQPAEALKEA